MNNRQELLDRLERLRPQMRRLFTGALTEEIQAQLGSATLNQLDVLRRLAESPSGSLTMGEVAAAQGAGASAATQMVDRLIREGLVERVHDDDDRRVVRVRPTQRSAALIERYRSGRREMEERLLAPLDDMQLQQFIALIERVVVGADGRTVEVRR